MRDHLKQIQVCIENIEKLLAKVSIEAVYFNFSEEECSPIDVMDDQIIEMKKQMLVLRGNVNKHSQGVL